MAKPTYDNFLSHLDHHNIERWLRDAADADHAHTIAEGLSHLNRAHYRKLRRFLARMMADARK